MRLYRQAGWGRKGRTVALGLCALCALFASALAGCGGVDTSSSAREAAPQVVGAPSSGHGTPEHLSRKQVWAFHLIGRRVCKGMTALEVAEKFKAKARHAGAQKRFLELVTEPTPAVEASSGYPQLVAAFYATTLPESERAPAAAGCAAELAASREGGEASSDRTGQEKAAGRRPHQKGNE